MQNSDTIECPETTDAIGLLNRECKTIVKSAFVQHTLSEFADLQD